MHFTRIGGRAREKAEKALGANRADGIINIEGKIARVATSKLGNERVSIFNVRAFHDAVLELGSVPRCHRPDRPLHH